MKKGNEGRKRITLMVFNWRLWIYRTEVARSNPSRWGGSFHNKRGDSPPPRQGFVGQVGRHGNGRSSGGWGSKAGVDFFITAAIIAPPTVFSSLCPPVKENILVLKILSLFLNGAVCNWKKSRARIGTVLHFFFHIPRIPSPPSLFLTPTSRSINFMPLS